MTAAPDHQHHHAIPYRHDIDGLRAISIMGVVLYHAFPSLLTGGFIGVDVFFVISGYLISSIIFKSLKSSEFSLIQFYKKRILRIFPALLTVLAVVYVCGWFFLFSKEFQQLGKHMAASAGFVQNLALLKEAGYFDTVSESKPLMHLWSLAIEEQFYIFYPLLIWATWKLGGKFTTIILPLLIASFAYSIYVIGINTSQAFFLPHARFWELLAGALLASLLQKPFLLSRRLRQACAFIGLLFIVGGYFVITPQSHFPGWWALLPTIGTFLIILSGPDTWVNHHLLGSRPMQFVGQISYPLYLWHWPVLAFAFIVYGAHPAPAVNAILLAVSFVLAWVTYICIERPLRFGRHLGLKSVLLLISVMLIGFIGFNTFKRDGLSFRPINKINTISNTTSLRQAMPMANAECGISMEERRHVFNCFQDKAKPIRYAVWGDSKAEALFWGLLLKQNSQYGWRTISSGSCPPLSGAHRTSPAGISTVEICLKGNRVALRALAEDPDIQVVVLGTGVRILMQHTFSDDSGKLSSEQAMWHGLSTAISDLERAGKKVVFLIDNPTVIDPSWCLPPRVTQSTHLNQLLVRPIDSRCTITYEQHLKEIQSYLNGVAALQAQHPNLIVYRPDHLLCDLEKGVCPVQKNGHFLYSYDDHLSDYGAGLIADELVPLIESTSPPSGSP